MSLDTNGLQHLWAHIANRLSTKVDKAEGKDLSSNDYTTDEKNKLAGIAEGANKTTVDSSLSSSSTNPVQNKVVNTALNGKVPTTRTVNNKALSSDITLDASDVGADATGTAETKAAEALETAKTYTEDYALTVDITDTEQGTAVGINADTLGGIAASGYVSQTELDTYKNEMSDDINSIENNIDAIESDIISIGNNIIANYALKSEIPNVPLRSINGQTGDAVLLAADLGAAVITHHTLSFPANGWVAQTDGSYTQQVSVNGITANDYANVDVDMSLATVDNYKNLQDAWALIGRAQSVNGAVLLTAFKEAPTIDIVVKLEVVR